MLVDFSCKVCKRVEEYLLKRTDPIPTCCDQQMIKVLSPSNFQLVGRGWAKDNYGLK